MTWRTFTIGELVDKSQAEIQTGPFGTQLRARDYVSDGVPVINVRNIGYGSLLPEKLEFITEETSERLRAHWLKPNDIVFGRKGGVDRHLYVDEQQENWVQGSDCIRLRLSSNEILPRFASFLFLTSAHQKWMLAQSGNKATMASLNHDVIQRITLRVPSVSKQQNILNILSPYDDLIENNRRRIALLEKTATHLYREWFVRLRFPGYEHTRLINGWPSGWKHIRLGDALEQLESGGRPKGGALDSGIPSIGAENILGLGRYDFSKEKYISEDYFERMSRGVVRNRDVLLYKDGANIGRASYFGEGFPHEKCAVNEHVFILRSRPFVGQNFLYFWVSQDATRRAISNLNANTAQPGISQEKLQSLPFVLPNEKLVTVFDQTIDSHVRQIFTLGVINKKLSMARELLLPKLISGEIAA